MGLTGEAGPGDLADALRDIRAEVSRGAGRPDVAANVPQNASELRAWIYDNLGITLPDRACCPEHSAVADIVWEAFAATEPRVVWYASRGTGKSVAMAALVGSESILLGAESSLLGGSLEQSSRVYEVMQGERSAMGRTFWEHPNAPVHLLRGDPTKRSTRLKNGGAISVLAASQKSARGPHPQRLRGDEIDEMDPAVWDAAQGQPMPARGIREQVVGCSTWQNPNGTMTREFALAREHGWPIRRWCWKCVLTENGGWLDRDFIERKRRSVPRHVWEVEYDLAQPAVEGRLIYPDAVEAMFDRALGHHAGAMNEHAVERGRPNMGLILEPPQPGGTYAVGGDWAKSRDKTIILTLRTDVRPHRVVQYAHLGRIPFPQMVAVFNEVVRWYNEASACHDATGIGSVIDDYLEVMSEAVTLSGKRRSQLFGDYVGGIEHGRIVSPMIDHMYDEHRFCTVDDVYGTGHPPDSVVAGALAFRAAGSMELMI